MPRNTFDGPDGLLNGGRRLWSSVVQGHELDITQLVQLEEACRAKDRVDFLHERLSEEMDSTTLKDANATANLLKQLIAALRLTDLSTGKRPQYRGPRGAVAPQVPGGAKVSSLDRARARAQG